MYGEMGIRNFRDLFCQKQEGPRRSDFFQGLRMLSTNMRFLKKMSMKAPRGADKKNAVTKVFDFCKNDHNLAKNTEFLAKSNFNSSANFGPLMTNDGALES